MSRTTGVSGAYRILPNTTGLMNFQMTAPDQELCRSVLNTSVQYLSTTSICHELHTITL